jgi:hypothetical protein
MNESTKDTDKSCCECSCEEMMGAMREFCAEKFKCTTEGCCPEDGKTS